MCACAHPSTSCMLLGTVFLQAEHRWSVGDIRCKRQVLKARARRSMVGILCVESTLSVRVEACWSTCRALRASMFDVGLASLVQPQRLATHRLVGFIRVARSIAEIAMLFVVDALPPTRVVACSLLARVWPSPGNGKHDVVLHLERGLGGQAQAWQPARQGQRPPSWTRTTRRQRRGLGRGRGHLRGARLAKIDPRAMGERTPDPIAG